MEEDFESLDNLVIKDKEYRMKKIKGRLKVILIIFVILLILAVIIYIIIRIVTKNYGKITCVYRTYTDEETIDLINIFDEDIKFILSIDEEEEKFNNKITHTFKKPGNHTVTFIFKTKLTSLENFFNKKNSLIEVDLSELEADKIIENFNEFIY